MGIYLVPADFAWLVDVRLREVLLSNFRERIEEAVRDLVGELPNAGAPRSCLVAGSEPGAGSLIGDSPFVPIVNHFPACAS